VRLGSVGIAVVVLLATWGNVLFLPLRSSASDLRGTQTTTKGRLLMSSYDDRDTAITRDPGYNGQQGATMAPPYQQPPYYGYGAPYGRHFGGRMGRGMNSGWSETKPFFMTSEFLATLLCIIGVCITAASTSDLNSHGAALFSTVLVAAYVISRGIAKAGTRSRASDPRDELQLGRSHDSQSRTQNT
jgi:hypothetical protein